MPVHELQTSVQGLLSTDPAKPRPDTHKALPTRTETIAACLRCRNARGVRMSERVAFSPGLGTCRRAPEGWSGRFPSAWTRTRLCTAAPFPLARAACSRRCPHTPRAVSAHAFRHERACDVWERSTGTKREQRSERGTQHRTS
eukprot:3422843-Rhodomonas_salina.1